MSVVVFDFDVRRALELVAQGDTLVCPKCKTELWIKDGAGRGKDLPIHPGIQCPKDQKHVMVLMEVGSVRERMRDVLGRRSDRDAGPRLDPKAPKE